MTGTGGSPFSRASAPASPLLWILLCRRECPAVAARARRPGPQPPERSVAMRSHPGSGAPCPPQLGSVRLCWYQQIGKPGVGDADAAIGHDVIDVKPTVGRGGAPDDLSHARDRVAHWRSC
jgi:hypothetical protein